MALLGVQCRKTPPPLRVEALLHDDDLINGTSDVRIVKPLWRKASNAAEAGSCFYVLEVLRWAAQAELATTPPSYSETAIRERETTQAIGQQHTSPYSVV